MFFESIEEYLELMTEVEWFDLIVDCCVDEMGNDLIVGAQ